jgi:hypothetical protein
MNKVLSETLAEAGGCLMRHRLRSRSDKRDIRLRRRIDAALVESERSLREHGGIPLETIKVEMRRRYGD